jgi:hypothetical protein
MAQLSSVTNSGLGYRSRSIGSRPGEARRNALCRPSRALSCGWESPATAERSEAVKADLRRLLPISPGQQAERASSCFHRSIRAARMPLDRQGSSRHAHRQGLCGVRTRTTGYSGQARGTTRSHRSHMELAAYEMLADMAARAGDTAVIASARDRWPGEGDGSSGAGLRASGPMGHALLHRTLRRGLRFATSDSTAVGGKRRVTASRESSRGSGRLDRATPSPPRARFRGTRRPLG